MLLPSLSVMPCSLRGMRKTRCIEVIFAIIVLVVAIQVQAIEIPGLERTAQTAGIARTPQSPEMAVTQIVQWVLSFVGVIFLVLMIWGGFKWMTAAGNKENISQAEKIVVSAVVGLIIVLSAYMLTTYLGTTFGARTN